jgi:hypothetical protein
MAGEALQPAVRGQFTDQQAVALRLRAGSGRLLQNLSEEHSAVGRIEHHQVAGQQRNSPAVAKGEGTPVPRHRTDRTDWL